jgi:hypothetical protein
MNQEIKLYFNLHIMVITGVFKCKNYRKVRQITLEKERKHNNFQDEKPITKSHGPCHAVSNSVGGCLKEG